MEIALGAGEAIYLYSIYGTHTQYIYEIYVKPRNMYEAFIYNMYVFIHIKRVRVYRGGLRKERGVERPGTGDRTWRGRVEP